MSLARRIFTAVMRSLDEDATGVRVTDTPAFQNWFAGSQAVDDAGQPLKVYTGTSKDVDFKHFKMPKNGVWFTSDPKSASEYAQQNDSQGHVWDNGSFRATNTASRVIPCYLKMLKPKRADSFADLLPPEDLHASNYRRAQGVAFDKLRAEGYDSIILGGSVYVMLDYNAPGKIKSAIAGRAFSDNKKNIHEGKVYQFDGGYSYPVKVFRNPSLTQMRVFVAALAARRGPDDVYLRGLMVDGKSVVVWDGWDMTHDEVLQRVFPDVARHSSDLTTFEIRKDGYHDVKPGDFDAALSPFVKSAIAAVSAIG